MCSTLFEMDGSVAILGVESTGSFMLYPLEGEVVQGFLFTGVDEAYRHPINAILVYDVDAENKAFSVVFSTLCKGVYQARVAFESGSVATTLLPSPPYAITAMSLMKSDDALHLTESVLKQSLPCTETLITTLADNSVLA